MNIIHGSSSVIRNFTLSSNQNEGLIPRIKPLCEVLERESALYAYVKGMHFQEMPCPYSGEALRNDVRKILNRLEKKHPSMKYTVSSSMKKIKQRLEKTHYHVSKCKICGEITNKNICQACQIINNLKKKEW